jgi:hypothetical protein
LSERGDEQRFQTIRISPEDFTIRLDIIIEGGRVDEHKINVFPLRRSEFDQLDSNGTCFQTVADHAIVVSRRCVDELGIG